MSDRGLTLFLWSDKNTLRELHPNLVDLKTEIYIFVPVQGKPAFFFFFSLFLGRLTALAALHLG